MGKTIYSIDRVLLMACLTCFFLTSATSYAAQPCVDGIQTDKTFHIKSLHLTAKSNLNLKCIVISWDSSLSSHVQYEVFKSTDSGKTWNLLLKLKGSEPAQALGKYACIDPKPQGVSWYKLRVVDSNLTTVAEEQTSIDYAHKYPSMLQSFISKPSFGNFSFSVKMMAEFTVVNKDGKYYKFGSAQNEVVVDGLPNGLYFLNLIGPNHIETYNVLIQ